MKKYDMLYIMIHYLYKYYGVFIQHGSMCCTDIDYVNFNKKKFLYHLTHENEILFLYFFIILFVQYGNGNSKVIAMQ